MILQEGYITKGKMKGFFVRLIDDAPICGGYYLLFSKDFSDPNAEGYDEWYESLEEADRAFEAFELIPTDETEL